MRAIELRATTGARIAAGLRSAGIATLALALAVTLAACSTQTTRRGAYFNDTDLQQIQPGMSQEAVRLTLGTPSTTSTVANGNAFYYISSTEAQTAFMKPTEVDRRIIAVYFNSYGSVERVANYGMKDGKIFDFVKRETPTHARDEGILKSLFRNLGQKQLFGD